MIQLIKNPLRVLFHAFIKILPDVWAIQILYLRNFYRFADLKNPKTYNEKINWRKINQRDTRFTVYADKLAVKDEIANLIGAEHVIPTLWSGEKPEDIPFDSLTPPYVIKVNHGYGSNFFIRKKEDIDLQHIYTVLRKLLRNSHASVTRELGYLAIPRKILIESMLVPSEGVVPDDYKFFVYHGRVHFILFIRDRFKTAQANYFDRTWNKLPFKSADFTELNSRVPKPIYLENMIEIAEKIGKKFDYVRVDLYHTPTGIFFGETTFYDGGGYGKIHPFSGEYILGAPWKIKGTHQCPQ